jgi:hypothetical protein
MDLTRFDYAALSAEDANALRCAAERINIRGQRLIEDIVEIGRELIEAKARVGHGNFLSWIDASFGMSDDTARNFMNVAEVYGDRIRTVRDLPLGAVYTLAAPSTPESVRSEVAERIAKGELVTAAEVRRLKATAAALRDDKANLADRIVELQDEIEKRALPAAIRVEHDPAVIDALYDGFVELWLSLPVELRARFLRDHPTPATTYGGDVHH